MSAANPAIVRTVRSAVYVPTTFTWLQTAARVGLTAVLMSGLAAAFGAMIGSTLR